MWAGHGVDAKPTAVSAIAYMKSSVPVWATAWMVSVNPVGKEDCPDVWASDCGALPAAIARNHPGSSSHSLAGPYSSIFKWILASFAVQAIHSTGIFGNFTEVRNNMNAV
jgi:hypothetical protein